MLVILIVAFQTPCGSIEQSLRPFLFTLQAHALHLCTYWMRPICAPIGG